MSAKISTGGVKKGRNEGEKIVTANRLLDGVVVYRVSTALWSEDLREGAVLEGDAAMDALTEALGEEHLIVGPYLMDVSTATEVAPDGRGKLRENIRDAGPTIIAGPAAYEDLSNVSV